MLLYYHLQKPFLNSLEFLNPCTALNITKRNNDQIECILSEFKSKFDRTEVLNEWYILPFLFSQEKVDMLRVMNLPEFWHEISNYTGALEEPTFRNI